MCTSCYFTVSSAMYLLFGTVKLVTCAYRHNLRGVKGYRYPHCLDRGVPYPTFQDEKLKNLLSPPDNRRSAETKLQ